MIYELNIHPKVIKFILKQNKNTQSRLFKAIYELKENPMFQLHIKKLTGYGNENTYRKRVGDFRIVYEVIDEKLTVFILKVGNRGDVYK